MLTLRSTERKSAKNDSEVLWIKQSDSVTASMVERKMKMEEAIMQHVLRFVPAKSLCRFKSVSKEWNRWICSPFLAHQQATHFTKTSGFFSKSNDSDPFFIPLDPDSHGVPSPSLFFLPESSSIRAADNGLLCCKSNFQDNVYFVCNPTTQDWQQLPEPTLFHGPASAVAFAFTPSVYNFDSHFQIVCALPFDSVNAVYFEIYSSRTNSWRISPSQYYHDFDNPALSFEGDGFFMDGTVYWVTSNGVVLGLDLRYEEHGEIRLPPSPAAPGHGSIGALSELGGELCYVNFIDREVDSNAAYSLGVYGGHDMVLSRRIPLEIGDFVGEDCFDGEVRVLSSVSDGVVIILVGRNVVLYHVEEGKGKLVRKVSPRTERAGRFLPYVNSLVKVCPVEEMPPEDRFFDKILKSMTVAKG